MLYLVPSVVSRSFVQAGKCMQTDITCCKDAIRSMHVNITVPSVWSMHSGLATWPDMNISLTVRRSRDDGIQFRQVSLTVRDQERWRFTAGATIPHCPAVTLCPELMDMLLRYLCKTPLTSEAKAHKCSGASCLAGAAGLRVSRPCSLHDDLANHARALVGFAVVAIGAGGLEGGRHLLALGVEVVLVRESLNVDAGLGGHTARSKGSGQGHLGMADASRF